MTVKKRYAVGLAAFITALGAAAACSFPELSYLEGAGEGGTPEAGGDAPANGADATDGAFVLPPDVDPDGGAQDATTTRPDTGPVQDAASGCCDCEGDGFQRKTGTCDGGPGPFADCDDSDGLVKPGQGWVALPWTSSYGKVGDWDCDGTVKKQYAYGVTCADTSHCSSEGFGTDVGCGNAGDYNFCQLNLLLGVPVSCTFLRSETRTQGCH